jgi:hypothetical protein
MKDVLRAFAQDQHQHLRTIVIEAGVAFDTAPEQFQESSALGLQQLELAGKLPALSTIAVEQEDRFGQLVVRREFFVKREAGAAPTASAAGARQTRGQAAAAASIVPAPLRCKSAPADQAHGSDDEM